MTKKVVQIVVTEHQPKVNRVLLQVRNNALEPQKRVHVVVTEPPIPVGDVIYINNKKNNL